jgi:hypothetical protein
MFYTYSVTQDGADFYLKDGSALVAVVTYPSGVKDFDLEGAIKARDWFEQLMRQWGIVVAFEGV